MVRHNCANQRCDSSAPLNLPAYTVEAHQVADVQAALTFATTHNIAVSVKSSGHSYESQSTHDGSLLIWMRHFEQTNIIHEFTDSCGTSHETLQVAGGQNFDDVFFRIKNNYHIVSGSCQTVVMGGGWLTGGGMSWTSRMYGYGVDNVFSMDVVLANGELVTADACNEHSDLFWAMRGGGGGNFGVITRLEYKLHPATKISTLSFGYASGNLFSNAQTREFASRWLELIIRELPTLDRRWAGSWNPIGMAELIFTGSREDALASTFMAQLDEFYDSILHLNPNFDRPSTLIEEFDGYHDWNGGDEAYENADFDSTTINFPTWYDGSFSRVLPENLLVEKPNELRDLIVDLWFDKDMTHPNNYLIGGKTKDVGPNDTAIHPAMRSGILEIRIRTERGVERMQELLDGYLWSVCYNHHSMLEANVEEACWGDNYARLEQVKATYDPDHRFNVFHGVSYRDDVGSEDCPVKPTLGIFTGLFFYKMFLISVITDTFSDFFAIVSLGFSNLF